MNLPVTAATRTTAILQVMGDLRCLRVGERLDLTDMMTAWTASGLRGDDLSTGLNEALAAGILEFIHSGGKSTIALTSAGSDWIASERFKSQMALQGPVLAALRQRMSAGGDSEKVVYLEDRRQRQASAS